MGMWLTCAEGILGLRAALCLGCRSGGRHHGGHPTGLAWPCCMEHKHPQACICSAGTATSMWWALCRSARTVHKALCFPAHAGGTVPVPQGQSTAQNAAGCSKMAMWKTVNIILSYCLLYVSVALNTTMTKVSTERPVGLCRDGVSPREVLMNMSAICQPHHHLKSAPASSGGWVSVFVALCKEHSNQNHCPGKKIFPI